MRPRTLAARRRPSRAQRKALKEIFPNKTFAEAVETIVKIDTDLTLSPVETAAQPGAAAGMPWTPPQMAAAQERQRADTAIDQVAPYLPGMQDESIRHRMAHIIQANPQLYGNAPEQEVLAHAYNVAVQEHNAVVQGDNWTHGQILEIAKQNEPLARSIVDVLNPKHPSTWLTSQIFATRAQDYAAAAAAVARTQDNARSVSKAKRVKAVKSSGGAIGADVGGSGLDGAIARAMSGR
jgi:hypothetical protein